MHLLEQRVVVIGRGPSGQDISLELATQGAKEVLVATLDFDPSAKQDERDTRVLKPAIDRIAENGDVVFTDGSAVSAVDEIMHCTGYLYTVSEFVPKELLFPTGARTADVAAEHNSISNEELAELRRGAEAQAFVAPLYKHLFSIEDPTIASSCRRDGPRACSRVRCYCPRRSTCTPSSSRSCTSWTVSSSTFTSSEPSRSRTSRASWQLSVFFVAVESLNLTSWVVINACRELATLSDAQVDELIHEIYADAGFLRTNFPYDYRSAEYRRDTATGKYVRHLEPATQSSELVQDFTS